MESLDAAIPLFERLLGGAPIAREEVTDQGARVAVFEAGESRVELLESAAPDSPIARFMAKRGPGIHHVSFTVPDLDQSLKEMEQSGVRLIDHEPRVGAQDERVAFLHPKSTAGVLIELVEEKKTK